MKIYLYRLLILMLVIFNFSGTVFASEAELQSPGKSINTLNNDDKHIPDHFILQEEIVKDSSFPPRMVLLAAYTALASYESEWGNIPFEQLQRYGWDITIYQTEVNRFIIGEKGRYIFLAIAGTENKQDLILNLKRKLISFEGKSTLEAHAGYVEIVDSMLDTPVLSDLVARLKNNQNEKLIISGHSLGGSVAILLGMSLLDIYEVDSEKIDIIAFAAPDMANADFFEQIIDYPIVNYTMAGDFIPNVFHLLQGGYGHNPNNIKWQTHTPKVAIAHAMIAFLDEAFYQAALTFDEMPKVSGNASVYVSAPSFEDELGLTPDLTKAYRNTIIKACADNQLQGARRDYEPRKLDEALMLARNSGAEYLMWLPTTVYSKKESKNNNYFININMQCYEVRTGKVIYWTNFVFNNGRYTMFPIIVEQLYKHRWDPGNKKTVAAL